MLFLISPCSAAVDVDTATMSGSTITITGTGFGSKSPAAPILFDNFETGSPSDGATILNRSTPVGSKTWSYYDFNTDGVGSACEFDSGQKYAGSFSAYQLKPVGNENGEQNIYASGLDATTLYTSYSFRFVGETTAVWKMDRTTGGTVTNPPYDAPPNYGWGPSAGGHYVNDCTSFVEDTGGVGSMPSASTWHRMEGYRVASTSATPLKYWIDYTSTLDISYQMCNSCAVCEQNTWVSPMIANNVAQIETWIDNVYLDNTQARVEVCDSATWAARAHCEIQIPTTWDTTGIEATVNAGTFADMTEAYLYVVDSAGLVNSDGVAITEGDPPDTTAPAITGAVMPATYNSIIVPVTTFTATDAVGVTGYCIVTTNSSAGCAWLASAPTMVIGSAGEINWYFFAKDAAGNISDSSTDSTTITVPDTKMMFYGTGSIH